tara:strand:- start:223 stop:444 length:222 start_codon:yes stop_codon:yes gene_type:complete
VARKRYFKRGIPDKQVFMNMNSFKPEHKTIILKHMKTLMMKINNDEITVDETCKTLDGITESLYKLKKKYDNE